MKIIPAGQPFQTTIQDSPEVDRDFELKQAAEQIRNPNQVIEGLSEKDLNVWDEDIVDAPVVQLHEFAKRFAENLKRRRRAQRRSPNPKTARALQIYQKVENQLEEKQQSIGRFIRVA